MNATVSQSGETTPASYRFDATPVVLHGGGCRHQLPAIVSELGGSHVLLVTDPGVIALGAAEELIAVLDKANLKVTLFSEVQPDPTQKNVLDGFAAFQQAGADVVVALGGGSPLDTAKVISILPANDAPLASFAGLHKIPNRGVPLIAVPTTAGTGSESTKVAVITDTDRNVKMMMLSAALQPAAAILDYELTLTMPPSLTAAVGVDTLTHGIEAYVSRKANAMSDPLALSCIRLVARFLQRAYEDPNDKEAREGMMLSAGQGGMAFSNSSVCLVHGMSRPLGAYFHLPHGISNAVLLPAVTAFSVASAPSRYAEIARTVGAASEGDDDFTAGKQLCEWLQKLNDNLQIPCLSECRGVTREVFEEVKAQMAQDALDSGSPANNPKVPSAEEIVALYNTAW